MFHIGPGGPTVHFLGVYKLQEADASMLHYDGSFLGMG